MFYPAQSPNLTELIQATKMASLPKQSSSKGFPSNTDVAAEYDTSNLATAWSFAERGGLFGLEEADDGARRGDLCFYLSEESTCTKFL